MSPEREKEIEAIADYLERLAPETDWKNTMLAGAWAIKVLRAERDALLKDAERMEWLAANLEWDGHGRWLPELHVELRGHASHRECLNATIDEAMASSSKEGK